MSASGYGALLRTPGARAFTTAALVGRMPIAMLGIGTVLLVEDRRGSYALAGLVSAAYALGLAALGPGVSRLVDALGQRRVLPGAVLLSAVGIVALVLLVGSDVPAWTLLPAAAVMSTSSSQLSSCARARWGVVLAARPAELPRSFAWEAVCDEVVFVLGPLLVVLCALLDPTLGLLLALVLTIGGTLWLAAQRGTEPPVEPVRGSRPTALRSAGLRTLVAVMLFVGVLFGSAEVSMVAFAQDRGSRGGAGVLLALIALGSGVAGLVYGARSYRRPLAWRLLVALGVLALGLVPLLVVPGVTTTAVWPMAPAALLAGLAISPVLIAAFALAERLVPLAARTEGYSWLNCGLGVGVAGGFALAGAVADARGAGTAFLLCLAGALAALGAAVLGRGTLEPAAGTPHGPAAGVAPAGVAPAGVAPAGVAPAGVAPAGVAPAAAQAQQDLRRFHRATTL